MRLGIYVFVGLLASCTSTIWLTPQQRHDPLFPSAQTFACFFQRLDRLGEGGDALLRTWVSRYDLLTCISAFEVLRDMGADTIAYGTRGSAFMDKYTYATDLVEWDMAELHDWVVANWTKYGWGSQFADAEAAFEDCFLHVTAPMTLGFAMTAETLTIEAYDPANPSRSRLPGLWDINYDWCMNLASPVYRSYWEDYKAVAQAANEGDGYFMDSHLWQRPGFDFTKLREFSAEADYNAVLCEFAGLVKDSLHATYPTKQLGINDYDSFEEGSDPPRFTCQDEVDFYMREGSIRHPKATELVEKEIRGARQAALAGRSVLMVHTAYFSDLVRDSMAALAFYYLAMDGNVYFLTNPLSASYDPLNTLWVDALEYDIGRPDGEYFEFASGTDPSSSDDPAFGGVATYRIFGRKFTKGLVLLKPRPDWRTPMIWDETTATAHTLDGTYRLLDSTGTLGPPVTSVTLRNWEGAILVRSE